MACKRRGRKGIFNGRKQIVYPVNIVNTVNIVNMINIVNLVNILYNINMVNMKRRGNTTP